MSDNKEQKEEINWMERFANAQMIEKGRRTRYKITKEGVSEKPKVE